MFRKTRLVAFLGKGEVVLLKEFPQFLQKNKIGTVAYFYLHILDTIFIKCNAFTSKWSTWLLFDANLLGYNFCSNVIFYVHSFCQYMTIKHIYTNCLLSSALFIIDLLFIPDIYTFILYIYIIFLISWEYTLRS